MTDDELRNRIRLGEDDRTELREERASADRLAEAIVAFANTRGGDIVIGVADDGHITGVKDIDEAKRRVDDICRNNIEPPAVPVTVEAHALDDGDVLVVHVPRGPERPYRTNRGVYYVRGTAGKRIATRRELLEIYQATESLHPDELPVEVLGIDGLDLAWIRDARPELFASEAADQRRILTTVRWLSREGHPTIAGLLCAGVQPERVRPYARVTAMRHVGTQVTEDLADRRELGGRLDEQLAGAQRFVREHLSLMPRTGPIPIQGPPVEAVDEALVNAVAHRDYLAAAQVRVFIFDDRVEVISPGGLLNTVSVEEMRLGCHVVRNRAVFHHLARLGVARDAGRGVPSMLSAMRARGLPEPEIVASAAEVRVTLRLR